MIEPIIHSNITDALPKDHHLAYKIVNCKNCKTMCHCDNNECMQTWVETGDGNYCIDCLARITDGVLGSNYALRA